MGFQTGQRVADYEVLGLLGMGGMGCVYRVRNVISDRTEAMKVLLGDLQAEPELAARFVSEIRTLGTLDHPNIAQLHTALQMGNQLLMLMEFVDGLNLQQMATQNTIPVDHIARYMHQVLSALGFAHSRGVVHRDIKPANVIVTAGGTAKLTDFGIAKSRLRDDLTRPGTTIGSLNYMAPEQAISGKVIDGRTDLYSLGITMYELLAGCKPFDDESAYVVLQSQMNTPPRPPIEVNPRLPKAINDMILKALEKDPANRFQSASEFSDALERATGIAASVVVDNAVPRLRKAARYDAGKFTAPAAAVTSRFPTAVRRRVWVGAGSLAIFGLPVVTALALPLMKSRAMEAAILPMKQWAPPPGPSVEDLTTKEDDATASDPIAAASDAIPLPAATAAPTQPPAPAPVQQPHPAPAKVTPPRKETAMVRDVEPALAEAAPAHALAPSTQTAVEAVRKEKAALDSRAAVVRQNVQRMKSEREANGSTLPQDVADAYVRMNAYLSAERSDLEDGDAASARDYMNKAATEVAALENLLNK